MPFFSARRMISVRISPTSWRTSWMFLQMPVPISMTDWCISGLTRSLRTSRPSSRISWTWERSSRVSGSMIWNSSSTPSVNAGRSMRTAIRLRFGAASDGAPGAAGLRTRRGRRALGRLFAALEERRPAVVRQRLGALLDALDQPLRGVLDDPREVLLADRLDGGVGRRVQEVDRVGNAVAHRELERAEVVAERVHELQAVAVDALVHRRRDRRRRP